MATTPSVPNQVTTTQAVQTSNSWENFARILLALVLWREDRGDGPQGMEAVGHVILNRLADGRWGDLFDIIEKKWQFSSMTATADPELGLWPRRGDVRFTQAMQIADGLLNGSYPDDTTSGATHYFNPTVVLPSWAASMTKTCSIGGHDYYK